MGDNGAGLEAAAPSAEGGRAVPRVIAVDGSAASGKSTIGRKLAEKLAYPFLDTGLMYRAVTLAALKRGVDVNDQVALGELAASMRLAVGPPAPGSLETCSIALNGEDVTAQ